MIKVNNRNTRARREICSKLTIKTTERRHWCCTVNFSFEHISRLVLLLLLLTLNMYLPAGFLVKIMNYPNERYNQERENKSCTLKARIRL